MAQVALALSIVTITYLSLPIIEGIIEYHKKY